VFVFVFLSIDRSVMVTVNHSNYIEKK